MQLQESNEKHSCLRYRFMRQCVTFSCISECFDSLLSLLSIQIYRFFCLVTWDFFSWRTRSGFGSRGGPRWKKGVAHATCWLYDFPCASIYTYVTVWLIGFKSSFVPHPSQLRSLERAFVFLPLTFTPFLFFSFVFWYVTLFFLL